MMEFCFIAQTAMKSPRKLNPLPDDKILDWSKMKQIVDNFLKCIKMKKKEYQ